MGDPTTAEDVVFDMLVNWYQQTGVETTAQAIVGALRANPAALADLMGGGAVVLLPCPNGCGCVMPEDADIHDCACDGPCCMGSDDEWPIRFVPAVPQEGADRG